MNSAPVGPRLRPYQSAAVDQRDRSPKGGPSQINTVHCSYCGIIHTAEQRQTLLRRLLERGAELLEIRQAWSHIWGTDDEWKSTQARLLARDLAALRRTG